MIRWALVLITTSICFAQVPSADVPEGLHVDLETIKHIAPHHLRLTFYVIVAGAGELKLPDQPEILRRALTQVSKHLGYDQFQAQSKTEWLVRSRGNMDRFLDYSRSDITILADTKLSFRLLYDYERRFITLSDLRLTSDQVELLNTSVGIDDGGAAIAGTLNNDQQATQLFLIATLEVSTRPFEGQPVKAAFMVTHFDDQNHDWVFENRPFADP